MEFLDQIAKTTFSNEYSSTIATMFLVLYGGLAAPKLPQFVVNLFDNPIFRLIVLSLIVYKGNKDPKFSIMIAVVFTMTLNIINKQTFLEGFAEECGTPCTTLVNIFKHLIDGNKLGVFKTFVLGSQNPVSQDTKDLVETTVDKFLKDVKDDTLNIQDVSQFLGLRNVIRTVKSEVDSNIIEEEKSDIDYDININIIDQMDFHLTCLINDLSKGEKGLCTPESISTEFGEYIDDETN